MRDGYGPAGLHIVPEWDKHSHMHLLNPKLPDCALTRAGRAGVASGLVLLVVGGALVFAGAGDLIVAALAFAAIGGATAGGAMLVVAGWTIAQRLTALSMLARGRLVEHRPLLRAVVRGLTLSPVPPPPRLLLLA